MVKDYLQALEAYLQGPWKQPLLSLLHAYLTTPEEDRHTIRWRLYNLVDQAKKTDGYGTALLHFGAPTPNEPRHPNRGLPSGRQKRRR
jgi:hypothetical protein